MSWGNVIVAGGTMAAGYMASQGGSDGGVQTGAAPKWEPWQSELGKDTLAPYLKGDDESTWQPPGFYEPSLKALEEWSLQSPYDIDVDKYQQGQQGWQDALTRGPEDIDDVYRSTVSDPLTEQFRDEIMPSLRLRQGDQMYSTSGQSAEERATDDLTKQLTRGRSEYSFAARESDLNRQLIAATGLTQSELALASGMRGQKDAQRGEITDLYNLGRSDIYTPDEQRERDRMNMINSALGNQPMEPYAVQQDPSSNAFAELAAAYLSTESGAQSVKSGIGNLWNSDWGGQSGPGAYDDSYTGENYDW